MLTIVETIGFLATTTLGYFLWGILGLDTAKEENPVNVCDSRDKYSHWQPLATNDCLFFHMVFYEQSCPGLVDLILAIHVMLFALGLPQVFSFKGTHYIVVFFLKVCIAQIVLQLKAVTRAGVSSSYFSYFSLL